MINIMSLKAKVIAVLLLLICVMLFPYISYGQVTDNQVADNLTISAGTVSNSDVTLKANQPSTVTGRLTYDSTSDCLQVGDGTATDDICPGTQATEGFLYLDDYAGSSVGEKVNNALSDAQTTGKAIKILYADLAASTVGVAITTGDVRIIGPGTNTCWEYNGTGQAISVLRSRVHISDLCVDLTNNVNSNVDGVLWGGDTSAVVDGSLINFRVIEAPRYGIYINSGDNGVYNNRFDGLRLQGSDTQNLFITTTGSTSANGNVFGVMKLNDGGLEITDGYSNTFLETYLQSISAPTYALTYNGGVNTFVDLTIDANVDNGIDATAGTIQYLTLNNNASVITESTDSETHRTGIESDGDLRVRGIAATGSATFVPSSELTFEIANDTTANRGVVLKTSPAPGSAATGDLILESADATGYIFIRQNGNVGITNDAPGEALDVTGNIAVSGTVDGRDIAADGVTLDGLASGSGTNVQTNTGGVLTGADFQDGSKVSVSEAAGVVTMDIVSGSLATSDIGSGTLADARVASSNVTQHEAALSITESQISDLSHTVDTDTQLSEEQVEDFAGGMVTGNVETGITVTYDDAGNSIDFELDFNGLTTATVDTGDFFPFYDLSAGAPRKAAVTVSGLTVDDEGTPLTTDATSIDFVGAGVTATNSSGDVTVTIPGGGGSSLTEEEVEDFVGGMLVGTETRITVTYDDAGNAINFVVDDMNDDVPESGDFGNAADLDSTGALSTDSVSANELNATGVETELEAVIDLQDLQGAVTDGQIPASIARDSELPTDTDTRPPMEICLQDPVAGDTSLFMLGHTFDDITIQETESFITGTTNVVWNIGHAATRTGTQLDLFTSDITLTSTAGQNNASGFSDATVPADSYIWLEIVSISGTPTSLCVSARYTVD